MGSVSLSALDHEGVAKACRIRFRLKTMGVKAQV